MKFSEDDDDFHVPGLPRRRRRRARPEDADENRLISQPPPPPSAESNPPPRASVPPIAPPDSPRRSSRPPSPRVESVPPSHESVPPSDADTADDDFAALNLPRRSRAAKRPRVFVTAALTSLGVTLAVLAAFHWAPSGVLHWMRLAPASQTSGVPSSSAASGHTGPPGGSARSTSGTWVMPDLVRMPLANALSVAQTLGLRIQIRERRADAYVPAESIVSQSIVAGSAVRTDDRVEVIVSAGAGAGTPVQSPSGDASTATTPNAAVSAANAPPTAGPTPVDTIRADAGSGAPTTVAVPRLTGLRYPRVRAVLEQAGLRLGSHRETYDGDRGPYVILWQSRQPGAQVPRGTSIDVVVNQGE